MYVALDSSLDSLKVFYSHLLLSIVSVWREILSPRGSVHPYCKLYTLHAHCACVCSVWLHLYPLCITFTVDFVSDNFDNETIRLWQLFCSSHVSIMRLPVSRSIDSCYLHTGNNLITFTKKEFQVKMSCFLFKCFLKWKVLEKNLPKKVEINQKQNTKYKVYSI